MALIHWICHLVPDKFDAIHDDVAWQTGALDLVGLEFRLIVLGSCLAKSGLAHVGFGVK